VSCSRDEQAAWARVAALAQEFAPYDTYVIASPMWNVQPTLTFRFSPEEGYRGLVTGKPVFLALARGGEYPAGSPGEAWDFQLRYLKTILGFIGFTDIRVVIAEPTLGAPETTGKRRAAALEQAMNMGAEF
jgi:FMN-dependent NADH-azoreductase